MQDLLVNDGATWKNIFVNSINGSSYPISSIFAQNGSSSPQSTASAIPVSVVNSIVTAAVLGTYQVVATGFMNTSSSTSNIYLYVNGVAVATYTYTGDASSGNEAYAISLIAINVPASAIIQLFMNTNNSITIVPVNLHIIKIA